MRYLFIKRGEKKKKERRVQRAPFDLMLAVQDKRPSFVSLADILAKTAHFGKLYLAKPRNERFLANCHVK